MHTQPPRSENITFMDFPLCTDLSQLDARFAILGIPYGSPYTLDEMTNDQSNGPTAIRRASRRLSDAIDRWNFDLGGTLFPEPGIRIVDCGDVPGSLADPKSHFRLAETAVREIIARKAIPIILGGDHGIPIPVFRALDCYKDVTLVHVDAHIDWRDDVNGVHEGYSSPIRRASELPHIGKIFQIGMRSVGSARAQEFHDAQAYGSKIFTSYQVHEEGMRSILDQIPDQGTYYLTIDADGMDPSVMPAVESPVSGGLYFHQLRTLIHGLASKGQFIGMDIVELAPRRDVGSISAITAGQMILNFIGAVLRS